MGVITVSDHGWIALMTRSYLSATTLACALALAACAHVDAPVSAASAAAPAAAAGKAIVHTPESLRASVRHAWVALPAAATGGQAYYGLLKDAPPARAQVPVVVLAHGDAGLTPELRQWQVWAAQTLGVASLAADSLQRADRVVYAPTAPAADHEKVHGMRNVELTAAVSALSGLDWADTRRFVIAGTAEGAVAVARYRPLADAPREQGRVIINWSCEDSAYVAGHRTQLPARMPVLNIVSSTDAQFLPGRTGLAQGQCGASATRLERIAAPAPGLMNQAQARASVAVFLQQQLALARP